MVGPGRMMGTMQKESQGQTPHLTGHRHLAGHPHGLLGQVSGP